MAQLATTLDRTADALHDASTTADTFSVTLDRTREAVSAAANTIIGVRTNLETLEGLDSRLTAIADGLAANQGALATNATSLGLLGDSMDATAERLRSGVVEDSLADVRAIILLMLLVLTAWTIVPAIGALAFGLWLRRELEPASTSPEVVP